MLQVSGVSHSYGEGRRNVRVLTDVTLSVAPGQRLGLVGDSGAGKSTLARVMALLMHPDAGSIKVDGYDVPGYGLQNPAWLRRQIQLVWQSPRLSTHPRYTLQRIIREPLHSVQGRQRHRGEQRLTALRQRVGLTDDVLTRRPHAVSDGQLQRACVLRALLLEPKYVVCDEFTAMVDASTQATLLNTVAEEQKRTGAGVVLITHDHGLARYWCHTVVTLANGRLSEIHEETMQSTQARNSV